jgi:hypothetical protein
VKKSQTLVWVKRVKRICPGKNLRTKNLKILIKKTDYSRHNNQKYWPWNSTNKCIQVKMRMQKMRKWVKVQWMNLVLKKMEKATMKMLI